MSRQVGAILLDTRSIQKYVFSCNKLKTNIGASYLVDHIFSDLMPKILQQVCEAHKLGLSSNWKTVDDLQIKNTDINCEIASIGGGNMLILVDKGDDTNKICHEIVGKWSRELLLRTPGLKTGAVIGTLDIGGSDDDFQNSLNKLFQKLKENQNNILPQVDLPYTGLTLECDYSGKVTSTNAFEYTDSGRRMVSQEVLAKTKGFKYASQDYLSLLGDKYTFTNEIEKLGYKDGESYICVIHIDGNNMGVKFSNCRSMQERKQLSLKVANIVKASFAKLVQSIIDEYDIYADYLAIDKMNSQADGKKVLPIRPIIIGGDDVTFVCPGRVGLIYAKRFIEFVTAQQLLDEDFHAFVQAKVDAKQEKDNPRTLVSDKLSCCGGIAIVPAKYPFFRAYELAEALCSVAKKKSRLHDDSLIDFAILHGDMYPNIEQLRTNQYIGVEGNLHYGPYFISRETKDSTNINDLLFLTDKLRHVPENKVKKLRLALTQDEHSITQFLENCPEIRIIMQEILHETNITAKDFWQYQEIQNPSEAKSTKKILQTRYIDAIEIMDFLIPEQYQTSKED